MKHDHRLDGIRGLAVLLVLCHHALQEIPVLSVAELCGV
jgi:peptidoglycan/LPS O-acetylase OafA/YrhL